MCRRRGAAAMNQLGLNIASQPDGLTAGYFTTSATQSLIEDPALKVKLYDFIVIGAASGYNVSMPAGISCRAG